jgi:hypothetical protein
MSGECILFKAGQLGLVVARKPQRPVGIDALVVDDVYEYLFDRPFPLGVAVRELFFG